jgi:hypothetical protein
MNNPLLDGVMNRNEFVSRSGIAFLDRSTSVMGIADNEINPRKNNTSQESPQSSSVVGATVFVMDDRNPIDLSGNKAGH